MVDDRTAFFKAIMVADKIKNSGILRELCELEDITGILPTVATIIDYWCVINDFDSNDFVATLASAVEFVNMQEKLEKDEIKAELGME